MPEGSHIWRFGGYELEALGGDLRRDGVSLEIQATPLRLLRYLVEHHGEVLSRDDILDHVWEGIPVSDGVLSTAVKQLRTVLEDREREPHWIETLRGRGLRFNAPVQRVGPGSIRATPEGRAAAPDRFPFVGRERTLERLELSLAAAAGGTGGVVLLSGEAGIGKSRTALECAERARRRGFRVYESWCPEGGGTAAYWPWIQLLRDCAAERGPSGLLAALGPGMSELARLVPELRDELPAPLDPASASPDAPLLLREGLARLLRSLAREAPVLWVVDDLQWADAASLRALAFASREVGALPILVLGAARLAEVSADTMTVALADLVSRSDGERIELEGLSQDEVAQLVALLAPALPAQQIWERTRGNPFFVREVLEQLRNRDAGEPASLTEVPPGVEAMIAKRLRRLSTRAREMVSIASLLGRRFTARVVGEVAGRTGASLLEALDEAQRAGLLRHRNAEPGSYEFSHELMREAVSSQIGAAQRIELHTRIASALERLDSGAPETLAQAAWHSLAVARAGGDARLAVVRAARAAEAALANVAWEEEVRQLQIALVAADLQGLPGDRLRGLLLLRLAEAQRRAGEVENARRSSLRAAELARRLGDPRALARAAHAFATDPVDGRSDPESIALLEEALDAQHGDSALRLRLLVQLARHRHAAGEADRALTLLREASDLCEHLSDPTTRSAVGQALSSDDWSGLGRLPLLRTSLPGELTQATARQRTPRFGARRLLKIAALSSAALVAVLISVIWLSWPAPLGLALDLTGLGEPPVHPPLPDGPSIAVLPFANLSGDPDEDYFSDGITEDLTTDLSRLPRLFVISRNSAFRYKGRAVDVRSVGRELGVRYVLEGSVRRVGERVRINAQLIDASTGLHIWAQRYDRELRGIFELQSQIAEEIQLALGPEIGKAEVSAVSRRGTQNLQAYDAYLQAMSHLLSFRRQGVVEDARRLAARALEFDPDFADAHGLVGQSYSLEYGLGWSDDPTLLERADAAAQRALEIDPNNRFGHTVVSTAALWRNESQKAVEAAERALEIDPNNAGAHMARVPALLRQGKVLPALESLQQVIRLDPRGFSVTPTVFGWLNNAAGRTDKAAEFFELARQANPDSINPRVVLAAYHELAGRHEEAQVIVAEILDIAPHFTALSGARTLSPSDLDWGREVLRRAGLPDPEVASNAP